MALLVQPKREESAHWYRRDGSPCHYVPKAKGDGTRPTTIADAKKMDLLPSVTGIVGVLDRPQLANWKHAQIIKAAGEHPRQPDESHEYWEKRVLDAAFAQVSDAQDLGTRIHHAIEEMFDGVPVPEDLEPYVAPVKKWVKEVGITPIEREVVLASNDYGFAGTCDFIGHAKDGTLVVLDWKTKKTKPKRKVESYPQQQMQIAAYGWVYWEGRPFVGANVYISTTEPGRLEVVRYPWGQIKAGWEQFKNCAALWRWLKGYDPRDTEVTA
jgi:hypothetical protein